MDKYEYMEALLGGADLDPQEITDIKKVYSSIPKLTDIQAEVWNYTDEAEQRDREALKILNLEEETTDNEIIQFLDNILYTEKGIEKQVKRIRDNLKAKKYGTDEETKALKGIIGIEQSKNAIDSGKRDFLITILKFAEIFSNEEAGQIEDIKDRVRLASLLDLYGYLFILREDQEKIKTIKNYERAYRLYKANFIKEKNKTDTPGLERTPTIRTDKYTTYPTDNIFSELDIIKDEFVRRNIIGATSEWASVRIERLDRRQLEPFDIVVYVYVCNLYNKGNNPITINNIYQELSGYKPGDKEVKVQPKMAKDIAEAMKHLASTWVSLEDPVHDIEGKLTPGDILLSFKTIETAGKGDTTTVAYYIKEKPYYTKAMELIKRQRDILKVKTGIKLDKNVILLKFFLELELVERINMNIGQTKLNINNVFKRIGFVQKDNIKSYKDQRRRKIFYADTILEAHKQAGNIKDFKHYVIQGEKEIAGYDIYSNKNTIKEIEIKE